MPWTESPLLLRTSFGAEELWNAFMTHLRESSLEFSDEQPEEFMEILQDPAHLSRTREQIAALMPAGDPHGYVMIAAETTLRESEHPLLLIDMFDDPGREFRSTPEGV
jgi:hypothetical protein